MSALVSFLDATPRYLGLLRSQHWSAARLQAYREQHLAATLSAAARIPFYADRFGSKARLEDFAQLPFLSRSDIRMLTDSSIALWPRGTQFARGISSGTTGARAEFLFDRRHQRGRFAARARYLRAGGWNPVERSVWLVGEGFLTAHRAGYEDPELVSRILLGVRFLSFSTDLSKLARDIAEIDPRFIYAYPSVLDGLLRMFESAKLRLPSLRRIFSGAEVLEDSLRDRTRHQLGVEISLNYGSTEAFLAWQCPAGSYHQNAEHVLIELVDEAGRAVPAGQIGRVLVTTLENYLMPLVRYEIGDYAIAVDGACSCGRTLPLMGRVVGRGMNLFRGIDGKLLATWDLVNVLSHAAEIEKFQIVQKTLDRVVIKYVAENSLAPAIENEVRAGLMRHLDPRIAIEFERVDDLARTPAGKFMLTLSEVPA